MAKKQPNSQGANIILLNRESVLLQLRDNIPNISYPDYWALPGGKTEDRETPEQTAIRELEEECGYKMSNPLFVMKKTITKDDGTKVDASVFTEKYDQIQPIKCLEGQEMKFIPLRELPNLKLVPWQRQVIQKMISKTAL